LAANTADRRSSKAATMFDTDYQMGDGNRNRSSRVPVFLLMLLVACCLVWGFCFSIAARVSSSDEIVPEKGAVCELDEQEFSVRGRNDGMLHVHRIFRIYNEAGKKYGLVFTWLNRFVEVDNMKAEVRNLDGQVIKKLRKDEIREESLVPGYVLYAEDRTKYFDLSTTTFPYSLEYSYDVKYKSLFYWGRWSPEMEIPVERSTYTLIVPIDFVFQSYQRNMKVEPIQHAEHGKRKMIFELTQVPPFKHEKKMPPEIDCAMAVSFAPAEFELDGYRGSTDSWEHVGQWYASLSREQYHLSSENQLFSQEMVAGCSSAHDTIKTVYRFLQRKTRYVAIQLGIGGYKPRDAESVLATRYGDCKDLATLFVAMLGAIGMKAYPVLIRTRDEGAVLNDFPSDQFNHVIVCVPMESDTLWLDCTCAYCPFGELPSQDEGCHSLLVMEDTATFITTPTSSADDNKLSRSAHAALAPDGSLTIEGTIAAQGNFESYYRGLLNSYDQNEKKEWLHRAIASYAPNHTLLSSDFESLPDLDRPFSVGFSAKLNGYAAKSGDELLLNLNFLSRVEAEDIPSEEERRYPVEYSYPYTTVDEVALNLPDGFVTRVVPEDQNVTSPFGSFQTRYNVDGDQLIYRRVRTITQRLVSPASYDSYRGFLNVMLASDRSFVVLIEAGETPK
jgi:hypothetical protein